VYRLPFRVWGSGVGALRIGRVVQGLGVQRVAGVGCAECGRGTSAGRLLSRAGRLPGPAERVAEDVFSEEAGEAGKVVMS